MTRLTEIWKEWRPMKERRFDTFQPSRMELRPFYTNVPAVQVTDMSLSELIDALPEGVTQESIVGDTSAHWTKRRTLLIEWLTDHGSE